MNYDDIDSPFTSHELEFLKDIGEYDNIMAGLEFMETMKKLPDDPTEFLNRLDKEVPSDPQEASAALVEISKNDPEFFEQILAYSKLVNDLKPQETKVEKVSIKQMQEQEEAEAYEILMKKLKTLK